MELNVEVHAAVLSIPDANAAETRKPKPENRNPKPKEIPSPKQDRDRQDSSGFDLRISDFGLLLSAFGTFLSCSLTSFQIVSTFR